MDDRLLHWTESAAFVGLLYSPVTMGLACAFRILNYPDLTCEGTVMISAAVSWFVLENSGGPVAALAAATLAGCAAGAFTGLLHVLGNVSRLLSGIITSAILYSLTLRLMGQKSNRRVSERTLFDFMAGKVYLDSDLITVSFCVVALAFTLMLIYRARVGRLLRIVGDSEDYCAALGSNPRLLLVFGLVVANGTIGLGGG